MKAKEWHVFYVVVFLKIVGGVETRNIIVFLGGGISQVEMIMALRKDNNIVIVVDRDSDCVGRKHGDYFINQSTWDAESIAPEVRSLCLDIKPSEIIVVSNSGGNVTLCAQQLSDLLGAGFASREAANAACSKVKFKQSYNHYCDANFYYSEITENTFDWPEIVREYSGDLFVKPDINMVGKTACQIIYNPDPAHPPNLDFSTSSNHKLLIESYFPRGRDLIVLALVRNGRLVNQLIVEEINFHEEGGVNNIGFCTVPLVTELLASELERITNLLLQELEIINAPLSISLRVAGNEIFPVEMHLDFGGENIFLLGEDSDTKLENKLNNWLSAKSNESNRGLLKGENELAYWALYDHKFSEWNLTSDLNLINRHKVIASTGREQWMFSLTVPESEKLLERLGLYV